MKLMLWEIKIEPYRLAKIQWILFKLFGYKPKKYPCGHTKSANGYYCHQPFDSKHCEVINGEKIHKVVCKCCGHSHMDSNCYIDPNDDENWFTFQTQKVCFKAESEVNYVGLS